MKKFIFFIFVMVLASVAYATLDNSSLTHTVSTDNDIRSLERFDKLSNTSLAHLEIFDNDFRTFERFNQLQTGELLHLNEVDGAIRTFERFNKLSTSSEEHDSDSKTGVFINASTPNIEFVSGSYEFDVKRDFATVTIQARNIGTNTAYFVWGNVTNTQNIPMSFIGPGGKDTPTHIPIGETKNLTIGMTLSNADQLDYNFDLELYFAGSIMDTAQLTVHLPSWDNYDVSIEQNESVQIMTSKFMEIGEKEKDYLLGSISAEAETPDFLWNITLKQTDNSSLICLNTKIVLAITNTGSEPISDLELTTDGDVDLFLQPSLSGYKLEPGHSISFIAYALVNSDTPYSTAHIYVNGAQFQKDILVVYTPPGGGGNWEIPPGWPENTYFTSTVRSFICVNAPSYTVELAIPRNLNPSEISEASLQIGFEDRCGSVQSHDTIIYLNGNQIAYWQNTVTVGNYEIPFSPSLINHQNTIRVDSMNYKGRGHFCANAYNTLKFKVATYQSYCEELSCLQTEENESNFNDELDNDCDGLPDCDDLDSCGDSSCFNPIICPEPEVCDNGLDDDGNGLTDYDDLLACQISTCENGIEDFDETDIDCGGSCDPCEDGGECVHDFDCITNVCNSSKVCEGGCLDGDNDSICDYEDTCIYTGEKSNELLLNDLNYEWDFYELFYNYDDDAIEPDPIKDCINYTEPNDIWIFPELYPMMLAPFGPTIGYDTNTWYEETWFSNHYYPEWELDVVNWTSKLPFPDTIKNSINKLITTLQIRMDTTGIYTQAPIEYDLGELRSEIAGRSRIELNIFTLDSAQLDCTPIVYYDSGLHLSNIEQCEAGLSVTELLPSVDTTFNGSIGGSIEFLNISLIAHYILNTYFNMDDLLKIGIKLDGNAIPNTFLAGEKLEIDAALGGEAQLEVCVDIISDCYNILNASVNASFDPYENPLTFTELIIPYIDYGLGEKVYSLYEGLNGKRSYYADLDAFSPVLRLYLSKIEPNISITFSVLNYPIIFNFKQALTNTIDEQFSFTEFTIHSPVYIHIYDSRGNFIGHLPNGTFVSSYDNVYYFENESYKKVLIPPQLDQFFIELEGYEEGNYTLEMHKAVGLTSFNGSKIIKGIQYTLTDIKTGISDQDVYSIDTQQMVNEINTIIKNNHTFDDAVSAYLSGLDSDADGIPDVNDSEITSEKEHTLIIAENSFHYTGESALLNATLRESSNAILGSLIDVYVNGVYYTTAISNVEGTIQVNIGSEVLSNTTNYITFSYLGNESHYPTNKTITLYLIETEGITYIPSPYEVWVSNIEVLLDIYNNTTISEVFEGAIHINHSLTNISWIDEWTVSNDDLINFYNYQQNAYYSLDTSLSYSMSDEHRNQIFKIMEELVGGDIFLILKKIQDLKNNSLTNESEEYLNSTISQLHNTAKNLDNQSLNSSFNQLEGTIEDAILTEKLQNNESIDEDEDGFHYLEDCNDTNQFVYPGALELCDGIDNNCDRFIDEGCLEKINLSLTQSWNLISIPLKPENNTVNKIFENINYQKIFTYNQKWIELKENDKINETFGLWVQMDEDQTLTIEGAEFESITISLKKGWNLVSYPSLTQSLINETLKDINYTSALTYIDNEWKSYSPSKPENLNTLNYFTPGQAYWINVE